MEPAHCETLLDLLAWRAQVSADRPAFTFQGRAVTFAQLWKDLNRFASFLLAGGLARSQPVVLALPNGPEFFAAFYGVQRAGGIAVPVFPEAGPERIFGLAGLCGAQTLVAPAGLPPETLAGYRAAAARRGLQVVITAQAQGFAASAAFPQVEAGDTAFLQYTSGSTGDPKGVILTHAALLTNIRQMIAGMQITPAEIFVSWLPVYHDMGLILKTMVPFYLAAQTHLLPTNLRDVRPWLETIARTRATFTAAPDFAYRLALRHTSPGDYDLTSLRVALNAAEPVRLSTWQAFEQRFGLGHVMTAGYGLAEATVGVSMSAPGSPPRLDAHGRVSVGRPFPDVAVLIMQEEHILPPGETGEIMIRSRANSAGYFRNPAGTERLFWRDGFFHSGDLGSLDAEGYLYIAGRLKNIIKRGGETISPAEIEEVADAAPGVRFSAALGIDRGGPEGEQVYVFAEQRAEDASPDGLFSAALDLAARVHAHMGFRPARVYLLRPRTIPLTHNGKIQHGLLKELYLDGRLRADGAILFPDY